jgi:hypothetical protein
MQALTELSAREGQLQAEIRARMEELALQVCLGLHDSWPA